jgi:hypothetical protein
MGLEAASRRTRSVALVGGLWGGCAKDRRELGLEKRIVYGHKVDTPTVGKVQVTTASG